MKIIPITKLRNFYNSLSDLSLRSETQLNLAQDLNRKENYLKLISFYKESKKHFESKYEYNEEPFISNSARKPLIKNVVDINTTHVVCSYLYNNNPCIVLNNSNYNFEYLEREVSPWRTTKAEFDTGESGKSSGTGGIDFIGWNIINDLPIIGEIKLKGDKNAFYAIIQLLTYLSELSTDYQKKRIKNTKLFGNNNFKVDKVSFYLYILLTDISTYSEIQNKILNEAKILTNNLSKEIHEIKEFVFLDLDSNSKQINLI